VSSSGIGAGGNTAQGAKLPGEAGNQGAVQEWLPQPGGGRASLRLIACERARIEPILSKRIEVYINLLYPCCDDRRNRGYSALSETNETNIRYYCETATAPE
jgi:hypothetical protein